MTDKVAAGVAPLKDGRGGFFAVDRRAWHLVCGIGMNAAVAYLVAARGTGGDNRTTKWSINAIETRTGISRSRARDAIRILETAGALFRDPSSKPSYPKYKVVPAHEIKGCEGALPAPLDAEHQRVHAGLGEGWVEVPKSVSVRSKAEFQRWGSYRPASIASSLVKTGHAENWQNGPYFRAIRYDVEAAARPDWIWLPNTLVDGAADEVPPVELVRQTGQVLTLRLLVNLYGSQALDEDGGIHFRRIRQRYARHRVSGVAWPHSPGSVDYAAHGRWMMCDCPSSRPVMVRTLVRMVVGVHKVGG